MLRLTRDDFEDTPETYLFPVDEARAMATRVDVWGVSADPGACDAAKRVEAALRDVEMRFSHLREIVGYIDTDPDRPRAA